MQAGIGDEGFRAGNDRKRNVAAAQQKLTSGVLSGERGVCTDRGVEHSVLSRGIDQYSLQAMGEASPGINATEAQKDGRSFPSGLGVERPFAFWSHKHRVARSLMRLRGGACF